jgi:hypothetical protein
MKLELSLPAPVPPEALQAHLLDPEVLDELSAGPTVRIALLSLQRSAESALRLTRWRFVAPLPAVATRFIRADRLSWVEEADIDLIRCVTDFAVRPDHYAEILDVAASAEIVPDGESRSVRTVEVELQVHLPIVGQRVERVLADGLRDHFTKETAIAARLARLDTQP